ncbi:MAG TPA: uroporphyrinogen decarboxylase [Alphaproteobacteria bacterium]|nr:uroporphyrinogen decarboxylase [Alphaproteobacteria bacterium]
MNKTEKPILKILSGETPERNPIWLMRQAGRYLPEYRDLRAKAKNFLNMCLTPEWATEITLQPIRRFDFDAAILFADILLVPMALGAGLEFREGEGPVLEKVSGEAFLDRLRYDDQKVQPVYETISRVKKELPEKTTLIGFCGAPWTVGCYMIDGNSKNDFVISKAWVKEKPDLLAKLISILIEASAEYLSHQIEAGAECLQIFESWGGLLQGDDFAKWVIAPTRELINRVKKKHPAIRIIGFPREATQNDYLKYAAESGVDAVSIDFNLPLSFAKEKLQPVKPLQGNLNPDLLVKGGNDMLRATEEILTTFGKKHIFNLGHGVVPQTPPEHVAELVKFVQNFRA